MINPLDFTEATNTFIIIVSVMCLFIGPVIIKGLIYPDDWKE